MYERMAPCQAEMQAQMAPETCLKARLSRAAAMGGAQCALRKLRFLLGRVLALVAGLNRNLVSSWDALRARAK